MSFFFVLFGVGRGILVYFDYLLIMVIIIMKCLYIIVIYFYSNLMSFFFFVFKRRYLCIFVMYLNFDGFFLSLKVWVEFVLFIICNVYLFFFCKFE